MALGRGDGIIGQCRLGRGCKSGHQPRRFRTRPGDGSQAPRPCGGAPQLPGPGTRTVVTRAPLHAASHARNTSRRDNAKLVNIPAMDPAATPRIGLDATEAIVATMTA